MLTVKFHVDLYLYAKAPQMKKLLISISSLALFCYLGTELFEYAKHQQAIENSITAKKSKRKVKIGGLSIGLPDDPQNRRSWEATRLVNPETGKMPSNMRSRELAFAKTLPKNTSMLMNWQARGPYNVGGRTRAAAIDITDENVLMAGGVSGGIWRSENMGTSWQKLTQPEMLHNVTCIAQDQREGKTATWYYGTGEAYGNSASGNDAYFFGNGVFKTDDNGETWYSLTTTASNSPEEFDDIWDLVWDIEVDSSNDSLDIVYAATYGAIHRSENGGETWTRVLGSTSSSPYFAEVEVTSTGVVYATLSSDGVDKGIWRSEDGLEWNNILPEAWPPIYDRIRMAINPQNEKEVYFIGVTPGQGQECITFFGESEYNSLWKYTYHAQDLSPQMGLWEDKSQFIPGNDEQSNFNNFYAQGSYNLTIEVSPTNPDHVFLGGTNLYVSTDGFSSSENINQLGGYAKGTVFPDFQIYETHHPDQHQILFIPSANNTLISANDGGLFKTENYLEEDVVWESLNNGYYTTQLYTATINEIQVSNSLLGGFQDNGNFYTNSLDVESPWAMPLNGDGAFAHITADEATYYMSIQKGKVFKLTIDEQGNRLSHRRIDPIGPEEQLFIHPFVVDPNDENIMYYPDETSIWRNSSLSDIELTNEWDSISEGWSEFIDLDLSNRKISSISVSRENPPNRLYVGTSKKELYRIDNANSDNPEITDVTQRYVPGQGMSSGDFFHGSAYISNVAIHPNNGEVALAVFSNYEVYSLYYTTNGGDYWQRAGGNLEQQSNGQGDGASCRWASIMPFGADTLYFVATSTGLYATSLIDGEQTNWAQMGANSIGTVVCEQVKTRAADSLVVLATHGNGVYTSKVMSVDDVIEVSEFSLESNSLKAYPNPTSDRITIQGLTETSDWTLVDIKGRIIQGGSLTNNQNHLELALEDFSPGLYLFRHGNQTISIIKE